MNIFDNLVSFQSIQFREQDATISSVYSGYSPFWQPNDGKYLIRLVLKRLLQSLSSSLCYSPKTVNRCQLPFDWKGDAKEANNR